MILFNHLYWKHKCSVFNLRKLISWKYFLYSFFAKKNQEIVLIKYLTFDTCHGNLRCPWHCVFCLLCCLPRLLRLPIVVATAAATAHIGHFYFALFQRLGTKYAREIIQYILNQTFAQCCENGSKYPPLLKNICTWRIFSKIICKIYILNKKIFYNK